LFSAWSCSNKKLFCFIKSSKQGPASAACKARRNWNGARRRVANTFSLSLLDLYPYCTVHVCSTFKSSTVQSWWIVVQSSKKSSTVLGYFNSQG
jgi:hypothetical protein